MAFSGRQVACIIVVVVFLLELLHNLAFVDVLRIPVGDLSYTLMSSITPSNSTTENDVLSQMHASAQTWKSQPKLPNHLQGMFQDNPELIQHIREYWIIPPGNGSIRNIRGRPTNLRNSSQFGQTHIIDRMLSQKMHGFMIECGAYDGYLHSNSIFFEVYRKWGGILIEAVPTHFQRLLRVNRRMFALNACLSPTNRTTKMDLALSGIGSGIKNLIPDGQKKRLKIERKPTIEVQCFPLYSVLAALGVSRVDFFSLDVEGAELPILNTIPFDKVDISTLTIETRIIGNETKGRQAKEEGIMKRMKPFGYKFVKRHKLDMIVSKL